MMKKHKRKILISVLMAILFLIWVYKPFSQTEFVLLNHLTKYDSNSNTYDKVYLVENPPKNSKELKYLIEEFEKRTTKKNENYSHLYVKNHDYIFFPALFLSENIDYNSKKITRYDLDNIDFLVSTYSQVNVSGKRIKDIYLRVGKNWFYKD